MTNWNDADDFFAGAGGKSASFKTIGDDIDGYVVNAVKRQQTEPGGELKFYADGNTMWQLVVTLETQERDDPDDDGLRRIYVRGQMTKAVASAIQKAGERGLRDGGRLYVRYTGDAEPVQRGFNGAKQYFAKYQPPAVQVAVEDEGPDPDDTPF